MVQVRTAPVANDTTSTAPCSTTPLRWMATASLLPPGLTAMPSAYSPGGSAAAASAVSWADLPSALTRSQ